MPTASLDDFLPTGPEWVLDWDGIDAAFPWIRKLRGVTTDPALLAKGAFWTQNPHHHAEGDVWTHVRMVASALVASPEFRAAPVPERKVAFAAALLHDVCKPETWALDPDGRVTNKGHSRMGANEARCILWRMGMGFADRERACAITALHQVPFWLLDRPEWQARGLLAAASLRVENRLLAMVAEADARGRICADRQRLIDGVELFREAAREQGCYDAPFPFANDHTRLRFFRDPAGKHPGADLYDTTDPAFTATLMSGLPASGKSAWIARETGPGGRLEGQPIVSMDRMRAEMRVRPEDDQGTVRQAALKRARELLAARRSFVWDALNLDRQRRSPLVALCDDYGARVRFVYIEVPEAEMRSRNRARASRVPDGAIDRMLRKWEPPASDECHDLTLVLRQATPAGVSRPSLARAPG